MAEVIYFSRVLYTNERLKIEGYLAHKWGSSARLPNEHPYKNSPPNNPPAYLNSTTYLTIAENQPAGTIVGEFNATDPEGGAITYHFVNGDNNNSLFTIDTNGTLKTATTFDYESNASNYTITVEAKDELNATTEGNFTISLLDVYEPSKGNHIAELNSTVNLEMIWVEPGTALPWGKAIYRMLQ